MRVTYESHDITNDISAIIESVKGVQGNKTLVLHEHLEFANGQIYSQQCPISRSFLGCFDEVWSQGNLVHTGGSYV